MANRGSLQPLREVLGLILPPDKESGDREGGGAGGGRRPGSAQTVGQELERLRELHGRGGIPIGALPGADALARLGLAGGLVAHAAAALL